MAACIEKTYGIHKSKMFYWAVLVGEVSKCDRWDKEGNLAFRPEAFEKTVREGVSNVFGCCQNATSNNFFYFGVFGGLWSFRAVSFTRLASFSKNGVKEEKGEGVERKVRLMNSFGTKIV